MQQPLRPPIRDDAQIVALAEALITILRAPRISQRTQPESPRGGVIGAFLHQFGLCSVMQVDDNAWALTCFSYSICNRKMTAKDDA